MKSQKVIGIIAIVVILIPSCQTQNAVFTQFLNRAINETDTVIIPQVTLADTTINKFLDLAITKTEQCSYFDNRLKYLYAFSLSAREDSSKLICDINCNLSVKGALGLEMKEINDFLGTESPVMGGFYYKNYLFTVPIEYNGVEQISDYPFLQLTDCKLRILATDLMDKSTYLSYLRFEISESHNLLLDKT